MRTHFYLLRTSMRNRLRELVRNPGKLLLYLLITAAFLGLIVMSLFAAKPEDGGLPLYYLQGIVFVFLLLFYGLAIQKGLASGDTMFEMNDVNLLFVAPVNPRATLLYGLIRLMGSSFWAGFFILFQGGTLANFGAGYGGVFIIFVVFILNTMVLTLLSLVIYSATNGNPARKRVVRVLAVAVFLPLAAFAAVQYFANGAGMTALQDILTAPIFAATPIIGWSSAGAIALIEGKLLPGLFWLGLLLLSGGVMLLYILRSRSDYYEDVLVAAETAFEKKRAAAEGDVQATSAATATGRVTKTGLAGHGASVFLYKHLRETFRQNRFGFFSLHTLIATVCVLAAAIFFLKGDELLTILQILMWMQIFMIGSGRGLLELYSHYLYLIPAPPFQKAIWSNMELVARTLAESLLLLGIPGLIMGSHPFLIVGSVAVYVLFALLLLGVNYLFMRWTDTNVSQGIQLMIYFFAVLLLLTPGLAAALFAGFSVGGTAGGGLGLLILSVWELLVAFLCFALSKNILHNCDMPSMKGKNA